MCGWVTFKTAFVEYEVDKKLTADDVNRIIAEIIPKNISEEERDTRAEEIEEQIEETKEVTNITRTIEVDEETTTAGLH